MQREHRKETKRSIKKEAAALDQAIAPEDEAELKAHVSVFSNRQQSVPALAAPHKRPEIGLNVDCKSPTLNQPPTRCRL